MVENTEARIGGDGSPACPVISTFLDIRRHLDSAHSYLIFENIALADPGEGFNEICAVLNAPDAGVLDQTVYQDPDTGRRLLVVRLSADSEHQWKERMLAADLPQRINFYFYGRSG